uniref:RNA helicase n=1 Tax=Tanacetum cinerariifolium TaxID=118510 RepID=A0A6L2ND45_TANCI|nr:ATP-dependent RNA helicase DBP2-like [Tanacetum cinerariifolium]
MIFKIDFAKAYDSIRWDFLDDILTSFGFGSKWRCWIRGSLSSGKASILVNGSPSDEFQSYREWSLANLKGIMNILRCFSLLSAPFRYLGVLVGENMSLSKAWDDSISKKKNRLSKWKVNALSIGGRRTLLKSVLGSTPIYNMSIFKVPKLVLNYMERLRRNFFNGRLPFFKLLRRLARLVQVYPLGNKSKEVLEGVFYVSWWSIWNFRNQLLFAVQKPRKDAIFDDIIFRSFTSILSVIPFKVGAFPVKYLGVPLVNKRLRKDECKQLVDKVKSKASVFLLSKFNIKDIEKVLKGFLWCRGDLARDFRAIPTNGEFRALVRPLTLFARSSFIDLIRAGLVKAFSQSLESFRTAIVVGGTNISDQRSELRSGVEIVVATPGRFIDHLQQGNTSLTRISYVVLDEADRMLDMGFEPQIREVMHNLPEKHQTLLFSATMPVEIEALAQEYLTNPVQVKVGKVSSPTENVSQNLEKITENEKIDRLLSLLVEEAAMAKNLGHPFPLTIVFVERKTRCDEVAGALVDEGLNAVALHGGRTQSEREGALRDFRHGPTNILVATDVASRGLDVTGVAHVVNLDLPKTMEDYVHRIGRTGRAGSTGRATSFFTDRDMFLVSQIRKAIADVQSGNTVAFATGKVARRKEKEAAAAEKEARMAQAKLPPTSINVEDKYKYMIAPAMIKKEGSADDAWDD